MPPVYIRYRCSCSQPRDKVSITSGALSSFILVYIGADKRVYDGPIDLHPQSCLLPQQLKSSSSRFQRPIVKTSQPSYTLRSILLVQLMAASGPCRSSNINTVGRSNHVLIITGPATLECRPRAQLQAMSSSTGKAWGTIRH
ncbi:hypothetical protein M405DRAFT_337513 [Rhizopogon salebrosus TDB-379]|nr:hypothetical protein M405DRAFT_337513 [Rhizopogon salebrosus TDB-379]